MEEGIDHSIAIAKDFDLLYNYHVKGRKNATIARVLMHSVLSSEFDTVPPPTMERAERCRDRLIAEVLFEGFFKIIRTAFCHVQKYEDELKPGDTILIRSKDQPNFSVWKKLLLHSNLVFDTMRNCISELSLCARCFHKIQLPLIREKTKIAEKRLEVEQLVPGRWRIPSFRIPPSANLPSVADCRS